MRDEISNAKGMLILEFFCNYGINKTTNFDLIDIAEDLEFPLKVLMKDELSLKHIKSEIPIIVNYQNVNQKGVHWVGYYKNFYFDSYGLPPLKILEKYVKDYNKIDFQSETDLEYCGQLSFYVLWKIYKGESFAHIIEELREILLEKLKLK